MISCTLRSRNNVENAIIFAGSDTFKAEQLSRIFGVKVPPLEQCHITIQTDGSELIEQDEDWIPLALSVLREHALACGPV